MEHDSRAYASDVFMFPFLLCSVKLNHNELVAELRILVAARARGDRPRCAFCCLPDLLNWLSLHAKTAFVKQHKKNSAGLRVEEALPAALCCLPTNG